MVAVLQRACLITLILGVALFVYFLVIGPTSSRYSIFKLAIAEPAPHQQLLATPGDDQARFAGPRLERADISNLARLNEDYVRLVGHVQPAVVRLDTTIHERKPAVKYFEEIEEEMADGTVQTRFRWIDRPELLDFDLQWETPRFGSGVFISEDGVILTSHHVVLDVDNIIVSTHSGEKFEADLIGADSTVDVAVLRVRNPDGRRFPVLNFADSDTVSTGEIVVAYGSPFGLTGSISKGMITGTRRRFEGRAHVSYIQTDALMDRGISGGPLTNVFGEVVGINTLVFTGEQKETSPEQGAEPKKEQKPIWQGIGLALPSNRAISSYEDLLRLGERVRPYLGVLFNDMTDAGAEAIGLAKATGALIYELEHDSPARGVLEAGDVVLRIGDEEVDSAPTAGRILRNQTAGAPLDIEVWRKGEPQIVTVTLGEFRDVNQIASLPKAFTSLDTAEKVEERIGLQLYELDAYDRQTTGLPADLGAIFVRTIHAESPLNGHILSHDVIHEVNGQAIRTKQELHEALAGLRADESSSIVLTRKRRRYYLELRPVQD